MDELLEQWRDPVFNDPHRSVPAALAARLTEMADEITAGENIAEAIANARISDAPDDLLVTPLRLPARPCGNVLGRNKWVDLVDDARQPVPKSFGDCSALFAGPTQEHLHAALSVSTGDVGTLARSSTSSRKHLTSRRTKSGCAIRAANEKGLLSPDARGSHKSAFSRASRCAGSSRADRSSPVWGD